MALLAAIDIDDQGTLKISRFTQALEEMGASVKRTSSEHEQSSKKNEETTKKQTDALTKLIIEHRTHQQEIIKQVRALHELSTILRSGTQITDAHTKALAVMNTQVQNATFLTTAHKTQFAQLTGQFKAGTQVTAEMNRGLMTAAVAHSDAARAALGQATSTVNLGQAVNGLLEAIGATGLAYWLKAVAKESFEIAARNEVLGTAMGVLANNLGTTNLYFETQTQRIRALGITTKEARQSVMDFAQAELSLADAAKVARAAQDLAVIAGKNSSESFATLTAAIQLQQPRLLRSFGILTNLNKVYDEYAKANNTSASALTVFEKRQAFVNLILEEAKKVSGAYEASMNDVGKAMGSTARLVEDLENEIGRNYLPVMKGVVDIQHKVLKGLMDMPPWLKTVAAGMLAVVTALLAWRAAIATVTTLTMAMNALAIATGTVSGAGALGGVASLMTKLNPWISAGIMLLGAAATAWAVWGNAAEENIDSVRERLSKMVNEADDLDAMWLKLSQAEGKVKAALAAGETSKANALRQQFIRDAEKMMRMYPGLVLEIDRETAAVKLNTDAWANLARAKDKSIYATVDAVKAQRDTLAADARNLEQVMEMLNKASAEGKTQISVPGGSPLAGAVEAAGGSRKQTLFGRAVGSDGSWTLDVKQIDAAKLALEKWRTLGKELDDTIDGMNRRDNPQIEITEKLGLLEEALGVDKMNAAMRALKTSREAILKMNTADADAIIGRIRGENDRLEEKAAEMRKARQEAYNAIAGTPMSSVSLEEANRALGEVAVGTDAYMERLMRASGAVAAWNKLTEETRQKYANLGVAAEKLKLGPTAEEIEKISKKSADIVDNISRSMGEMFRSMESESVEFARHSATTLTDLELDLSRKVEAQAEDTYDRMNEAHESGVDNRIKLNNRYYRDLRRNIEDEIRMIQRRRVEDQKAAEEKHQRDSASLARTIENAKKEFKIREEHELAVDRMQKAIREHATAESQQATLAKIKADFDAEMDAIQTQGQRLIDARLVQETTFNRERSKLEDGYIATQQGRLDALVGQHADANARILRDHQYTFQQLHEFAQRFVSTVLSGLGQIIMGTRSLKDVLISIWQSISNSVLSIVNDMVTQIVRGFMGIGTKGGGLGGVKQALMSMFGKATVGPVAGMTVAGMPGYAGLPGVGAGGAAAGAGGGLTGLMAGGGIGVLGGLLGFGLGRFGSTRLAGGGIGAGAGAATGAMLGSILPGIGTAAGAFVGGAAGFLGGLISGGGDRRRAEKARATFIEEMGGMGRLGDQAVRTDVSLHALLTAKSTKEVEAQQRLIVNAIQVKDAIQSLEAYAGGFERLKEKADKAGVSLTEVYRAGAKAEDVQYAVEKVSKALQLQDAKDGLARTWTDMETLRRKAQMLGFDLRKLYDAKTVEEFANAQKELGDLMEEQDRRLAGIGQMQAGTQSRAEALAKTYDAGVGKALASVDDDQMKHIKDLYARAVKDGFKGGIMQFVASDPQGLRDITHLTDEDLAKLRGTVEQVQKQFGSVATYVKATFAAALKETGDFGMAFGAIGESLDVLGRIKDETGIAVDASTQKLLDLRKKIVDNEDVVQAAGALGQIIRGAVDAKVMTQDLFSTVGADAAAQFDVMIERGFTADEAMMTMQSTLQAMWQAQKDFGFTVDENTQKIIDQAVEQGYVGSQFQDINGKILDVLLLIAQTLGADIPEGFQRARDAAVEHEQAVRDAQAAQEDMPNSVHVVRDAWETMADQVFTSEDAVVRFADVAVRELARVEAAVNAISFGHSPGGLKEWAPLFERGYASAEQFSRRTRQSLAALDPWMHPEATSLPVQDWRSADAGGATPAPAAPAAESSTPANIHVHLTLDGREVAYTVVPYIPGATQRMAVGATSRR